MLRMAYGNGEKTITKISAKNQNRAQQWRRQNTHYMRYLRIPPPQNKYLIINILNNKLMTHLTSFKKNLPKQRPHL